MKISPQIALFSLCTSIGLFLASSHVNAQSGSPSTDQTITENLKNRLKETINAIDVAPTKGPVGYVGTIRDIVKNTLVIEDKAGKKNVLVTEETTLVRAPGNAEIKLDAIKIGDAVIAIGTAPNDGSETVGKRIIVSESPFTPPIKATGMGRLSKVKPKSAVVTDMTNGNVITLSFSDKTVVKTPLELISLEDLNDDDIIIYSGLADEDDNTVASATVLMRIKSGEPEPSVSATPSASTAPKEE